MGGRYPVRVLGPPRFSRLAAGQPHRMAQLSVGSAELAGLAETAGTRDGPLSVRRPDLPPNSLACSAARPYAREQKDGTVRWMDGRGIGASGGTACPAARRWLGRGAHGN